MFYLEMLSVTHATFVCSTLLVIKAQLVHLLQTSLSSSPNFQMASSSNNFRREKTWTNIYEKHYTTLYVCIKSPINSLPNQLDKNPADQRFVSLTVTEAGTNPTKLHLFLNAKQWAGLRERLSFIDKTITTPFVSNAFGEHNELLIVRVALPPSGTWATSIILSKRAYLDDETNKSKSKFNASDFDASANARKKPAPYQFDSAAIIIDAVAVHDLLTDRELEQLANATPHNEPTANV